MSSHSDFRRSANFLAAPAPQRRERSSIKVTLLRPAAGTGITPGACVNGVGWITADCAISEVLIRIGGHILGTARIGLSPPELASLIDQFPDGPATGFAFAVIAPSLKPGPATIRLDIRTGGRRARRNIKLMVAATEMPAPADAVSAMIEPAEVGAQGRLQVETLTGLDIERLICSRNGVFAITGQAVAEAGVAEIRVELDGELIGTMRLDEARANCAPASRPGFRLVRRIPPPRADRVQLRLTVLGRDQSRRVCHRDIPVAPRAWS